MRILALNYEYPPLGGGGGIAHQDLLEALARQHEILLLTTHFRGLKQRETRRGVRMLRLPVLGRTDLPTASIRSMLTYVPAALVAGLRTITTFKPDVIHAFFAVPSGLPAVLLGRLFHVPTVVTLVGADVYDPDPTAGIATHRTPGLRTVIRGVIRSATARTAISEDTKRRAMLYHGAPADVLTIPLGFVAPAPPVARAPDDRTPPLFRLLTIGRLIPRKGTQDLLLALALLKRSQVTLDIIGDGPLRDALERQASELGLEHVVRFRGAVSEQEKWGALARAHCFVSASHYEGFGMVFLEAMHVGLPIVATDKGGQTDILTTGENALLVPPEQPAQLAAALALLIDTPELRGRLAAANRRKGENYRMDRISARYVELFERLTTRPEPVPSKRLPTPMAVRPGRAP